MWKSTAISTFAVLFFSRHNIEIARLKCLRGLLESASISQRSQWFHSFQGWICHGEREVNRRASLVQVSGRNGWISSANREKLAKIRNETWARLESWVHLTLCTLLIAARTNTQQRSWAQSIRDLSAPKIPFLSTSQLNCHLISLDFNESWWQTRDNGTFACWLRWLLTLMRVNHDNILCCRQYTLHKWAPGLSLDSIRSQRESFSDPHEISLSLTPPI